MADAPDRAMPYWLVLACLPMVACSSPSPKNVRPASSEAALRLLKAGNARFVDGRSKHPHAQRRWWSKLAAGQHPYAVVLGCSDSRVPPELIFDAGIGDLFVIRVAGNVVDTDVAASIEYGIEHLDARLVVVLGHDGCGAVTAAVNQRCGRGGHEPPEIIKLLDHIMPALSGLDLGQDRASLIRSAVERNAALAAHDLSKVAGIAEALVKHRSRIVRAVYSMTDGRVRWLEGPNATDLQRAAQPVSSRIPRKHRRMAPRTILDMPNATFQARHGIYSIHSRTARRWN